PPPPRGLGHRGESRFFGNIGLEREAFPARLPRHCHRLLGGGEIVVDGEHLGPFLNEAQHGGTAVAHAFARGLACTDDDGDFVLGTHWTLDDAATSLWKFRDGNEPHVPARIAARAANSAGISM